MQDEAELDELMQLLHEPLPVSFRLNLHRLDAARFVFAASPHDVSESTCNPTVHLSQTEDTAAYGASISKSEVLLRRHSCEPAKVSVCFLQRIR